VLTSLVTADGTGFTSFGWRRVTSWTPDYVEDHEGTLLYLRDEDDGTAWSVGSAPVASAKRPYTVSNEPGVLRIVGEERGIEAACEIMVAADAHAELRWLRLCNASTRRRRLSVTSYLGVVLDHAGAYAGHPAFSKLFVQTSVDAAAGVLLARRRMRAPAPEPLHLAQMLHGVPARSSRRPGASRSAASTRRVPARGSSCGTAGRSSSQRPTRRARRPTSPATGARRSARAALPVSPTGRRAPSRTRRTAPPRCASRTAPAGSPRMGARTCSRSET
jgi:cyclic beta-1,2-glucan synthetase